MAGNKHAKLEWTGNAMDLKVSFDGGYSTQMSGPATADGATPMEFLLAAAAGCTAMDMLTILRKKRQPVEGLSLEVSGQQAENAPNVYTAGKITYVITGDVDPKAVEQAIELSMTKYCSASIMLKNSGMKLETAYRIQASAPAAANS
ncbi:MAG: OsmC family protein [Caldilineaceae bacterium]|nr:OsmC family protein [Caldilineaceae bacterium]